jgi:hypothetical protein
MTQASRLYHKAGLVLKKHSPEILLVGGVVGGVVSTVMACKASTKVNDVIEEAKENLEIIREAEIDEKDAVKAKAAVYIQTGGKLVKLYGPSVALGTASVVSVLASNNILRKRVVAHASVAAAATNSLKEYRERVVERFGDELDKELLYDIRPKEVEETVVNDKGEEETVKKTVEVADPRAAKIMSPFSVFFDETCQCWHRNAEYNKNFLIQQQRYANEKLVDQGHLFLNEVYDMIGVPRTEAGQLYGWVYRKDDPNFENYVDFGIFNLRDKDARLFVNGHEKSILLDFNPDGEVYKLMK